ncbi:MAG: hypothetical protein PHH82_01375 [Candidatus ainarchaeum sp.]|nr:hypothetical protein [Candidatus ainarchaeum sp.]
MDVLKNVRNRGGLTSTVIQYTCMNCKKVILESGPGAYGRRFCCEDCKDEYMEKTKQASDKYQLSGAK